jgi:hypothetical protein
MPSRSVPVPDSMNQLQQQFDQFRRTRTGRRKLPEALWQAAVEQARRHGVNVVAHTLRLDYSGLNLCVACHGVLFEPNIFIQVAKQIFADCPQTVRVQVDLGHSRGSATRADSHTER